MEKILLFTDSLGAGGAQRQLAGLAVLLKNKGYEVKVCTYYDIGFYNELLDEANVPRVIIPGADNTKLRILRVYRYFKQECPDWVIAYQETPSLVASAAKVLGCKYRLLVSERNTTQKIGINERVRFFLYRWADAIVPNSYTQERFLLNHHSWMKSKLSTISNFVDLEKFTYIEHTRNVVPEIVVAATVWPSKNTKGLIKAIAKLKNMGVKFHVSWYGIVDDYKDYVKECMNLINELEVVDYIVLLPKTKEIHKIYQAADYFCLPSFFEGTPNVICEAISTGLPVICSDVCDNRLYVKEGLNGMLYNPEDIKNIADTIQKALSIDNDTYSCYRLESRKIAEEMLSSAQFVNKYIEIINK